ncbi:MAG: MaoC family dehydratase [Chloroflexota bacterium]
MGIIGKAVVGTEIGPLVKHMTQEKMTLFSGRGREGAGGIHISPDAARDRLGLESPIASGQMSLGYAAQMLRQAFGVEAFNHTGTVDLVFVRPVVHGDTVTVKGTITETKPEGKGQRVIVKLLCENQNGERTATGTGSVLIPM